LASKKKTGTAATKLRDEMAENLSVGEDSDLKRVVAVMTKLDKKVVKLVDMLVKLDIFNSRSEAIASIVEKTVFSQLDKFELIQKQIDKLEEIQETAKDIAQDVLSRES
jgi:Arc/MetJ-type ribon-helix-helix transcriptional regulator